MGHNQKIRMGIASLTITFIQLLAKILLSLRDTSVEHVLPLTRLLYSRGQIEKMIKAAPEHWQVENWMKQNKVALSRSSSE